MNARTIEFEVREDEIDRTNVAEFRIPSWKIKWVQVATTSRKEATAPIIFKYFTTLECKKLKRPDQLRGQNLTSGPS